MGLHKVSKGLSLPISGKPEQRIEEGRKVRHVALLGGDYVGLKPTMLVKVGDDVRRGQPLFEDKKLPGVVHTAPASGRVKAIHRGERRAFLSLIIELSEEERSRGSAEDVSFDTYTGKHPNELNREQVRALLIESGLWTSFRARPYGRVADPATQPASIFVTASDSHPLAPDMAQVLDGRQADLDQGLAAIAKLTDGKVFFCTTAGSGVRTESRAVTCEEFSGPHPSGTVGLHIHTLDPVHREKTVWHLSLQDVIAIGKLFATGRLHVERIISLAGPSVRQPRLLRTRLGASTTELVDGEISDEENRIISGSVLSGRTAGCERLGFLGRYDQAIAVIAEDRKREFLGWLTPGLNSFSVINTYLSKLMPGKQFPMTTSTHGSHRAIVPIGMYEKVMPFDLAPTFLLKSLLMHDVERAEELGCLELSEEDLALCTFVCPGKNEYGPYLRDVLTTIEKEG